LHDETLQAAGVIGGARSRGTGRFLLGYDGSMTSSSPVAVACVGLATLDLIHRIEAFPPQPVKVRALSFAISAGGMSAGAACAIARLGGAAQFWGPIGDDTFGDLLRGELRKAGVEADWVAPVPASTSSHSAVIVDAAGERLLINHRGSALAAGADILPLARLDVMAVLTDARWTPGAAAALEHAQRAGIPSVIDAEMGDPAALRELVPRAGHVIFSENGFAEWAGFASDDADRAGQRLQELVASGAELAAITHGPRSILYATREGLAELEPLAIDAVETLGAGDVFHGAYALALARGSGIVPALRYAAGAATLKCMRAGGRAAMPGHEEVVGFLRDRG
jgi:sulfofructose kinase